MSAEQPNIVVFFWDNLGWGEVGCYGGGVLRGAPTPRIDALAGSPDPMTSSPTPTTAWDTRAADPWTELPCGATP